MAEISKYPWVTVIQGLLSIMHLFTEDFYPQRKTCLNEKLVFLKHTWAEAEHAEDHIVFTFHLKKKKNKKICLRMINFLNLQHFH